MPAQITDLLLLEDLEDERARVSDLDAPKLDAAYPRFVRPVTDGEAATRLE